MKKLFENEQFFERLELPEGIHSKFVIKDEVCTNNMK